jgi:L-threonylcarbamoyladenylate synthase
MGRMTGPRLLRVDPTDPSPKELAEAGALLRAGGLVAFPTETVYGLGADACSAAATGRIFAAKGRPPDNPLIVHVDSLASAQKVTAWITPLAERLAERWWPGPLTLVLEADPGLPAVTTAGLATVAVRVPSHPVALALLRQAAIPVAAPSANQSGRPSPTTARHVVEDLGAAVDLVLDAGETSLGVESTVVDARGEIPVVLREGAVTREMLGLSGIPDADDLRRSPGTRHRHYAPSCEVVIAPTGDGVALANALAAGGRKIGLVGFTPGRPPVTTIDVVRDAGHLAQRLYGALRDAERIGMDVVVVEAVPETGIGRAVMDRLRRAAAG